METIINIFKLYYFNSFIVFIKTAEMKIKRNGHIYQTIMTAFAIGKKLEYVIDTIF